MLHDFLADTNKIKKVWPGHAVPSSRLPAPRVCARSDPNGAPALAQSHWLTSGECKAHAKVGTARHGTARHGSGAAALQVRVLGVLL